MDTVEENGGTMTVPVHGAEPGPLPAPNEDDAEPARATRLAALVAGVVLLAASGGAATAASWFATTWGPSIGPLFQVAAVVVPLVLGAAALTVAFVPSFVHFAEGRLV